ncbi:hypothetical protein B0H66DRAFT_271081 [Apodospora peruviana]|uniref:F-box domain-containing protein n=1 Tax=Apodospora peruviana TaxID=516989 RepID=A0AAE0I1D3_9PEZI|nr:hypothetical protein B0H66DRAFT_271081 [Apodospora peruviana]
MPKSPRQSKRGVATRFMPYRRCAKKPPRFPGFLSLPAELRLQIYSHILLIPGAADVCGIWNETPVVESVALLRVSKQISAEAAHYLYSRNTFSFLEPCDDYQQDGDDITSHRCYHWLDSIGPTNASSVRRLQLRMRAERSRGLYYDRLFRSLSVRLPNLSQLALVTETHQMARVTRIPPGGTVGGNPTGGHTIHRWDPNHITPLPLQYLQLLQQIPLRQDIFPRLTLLVIAEPDPSRHPNKDKIDVLRQAYKSLCSLVYVCQVRCIEPRSAARRLAGGNCINLFDQKPWEQSAFGDYGRVVRRCLRFGLPGIRYPYTAGELQCCRNMIERAWGRRKSVLVPELEEAVLVEEGEEEEDGVV